MSYEVTKELPLEKIFFLPKHEFKSYHIDEPN